MKTAEQWFRESLEEDISDLTIENMRGEIIIEQLRTELASAKQRIAELERQLSIKELSCGSGV